MPSQSPDASLLKVSLTTRKPLLRPKPDHRFIKSLRSLGYERIIGIDEVGRGALAGPVVVAAVEIYQPIVGVTDSKLLSSNSREDLSNQISKLAKQVGFGFSSNKEIDQLGLVVALELAYQRCLDTMIFDLVLTDHYSLPNQPHIKSIKGDQLFYSVAAASIVAKVYRDQLMTVYHQVYPQFNWHQNAGYGTLGHRKALNTVRLSPLHRTSFLKETR